MPPKQGDHSLTDFSAEVRIHNLQSEAVGISMGTALEYST